MVEFGDPSPELLAMDLTDITGVIARKYSSKESPILQTGYLLLQDDRLVFGTELSAREISQLPIWDEEVQGFLGNREGKLLIFDFYRGEEKLKIAKLRFVSIEEQQEVSINEEGESTSKSVQHLLNISTLANVNGDIGRDLAYDEKNQLLIELKAMKEALPKKTFEELCKEGRILKIACDGQDGAGKGTCRNLLSQELNKKGYDVLEVDFPHYDLPWGKFIKEVLYSQPSITLEEKMFAYALNRLEVVDSMRSQVEEIYKANGRPVYILFDRFVTSNVLSLAHFLSNNKDVEISNEFLKKWYDFMFEIDNQFIEKLHLEQTEIFVPVISAEKAIEAIDKDSTRGGKDSHENEEVQGIAKNLYERLCNIDSRVKIIQGEINGGRIHAEDIVKNILEKLPQHTEIENKTKGGTYKLEITKPAPVRLMQELMKQRGFKNLLALDPYKQKVA